MTKPKVNVRTAGKLLLFICFGYIMFHGLIKPGVFAKATAAVTATVQGGGKLLRRGMGEKKRRLFTF